jgi:hypothetical protein
MITFITLHNIKLTVFGEYMPPETGYSGGFDVQSVSLEGHPAEITDLLSETTMRDIEAAVCQQMKEAA